MQHSNLGSGGVMLFRQLFDPETSTYTHLLADARTREAVLIDSVREQLARDVELIEQLELRLLYALETHVHADHVTAAGLLRQRFGCKVGVGALASVATADLQLADGATLRFGAHALEIRATPGHTAGCVTYVCHEQGVAFTGDALLIRGCGRTDFQGGDARALYASVRHRILDLPPATNLYPAHDYRGRMQTTVAEERRFNPRLGDARSEGEFLALMGRLRLAYPKRMDESVPANLCAGITVPEETHASRRPEDRWAPVSRTPSGVPAVEGAWVEAHRRELHLVDVREPLEFCGPLGHLEGAELVPLAHLAARAKDWDRARPLVTVCTYGVRSGKAALHLSEAGFERVASLHGGLVHWGAEGRPVVEVLGDRSRQDAEAWHGDAI
jgi:glyoxylase-like metal-dependent hydrolase (beta-lactamase superfamily II)/rhodanese-related sulfurtransferase